MHTPTFQNTARKTILSFFIILVIPVFVFAQQENENSSGNRGYLKQSEIPEIKKKTTSIFEDEKPQVIFAKKKSFSALQLQARAYRQQGLGLQRVGDLKGAMVLYQKAIEIDPGYAVAYNDLGIIYEARGFVDRAESSYLKTIQLDPYYLSTYSNLALLYENKYQLEKAAYYWQKRVVLGMPDDPWTQKAKTHLDDIELALGRKPTLFSKAPEVIKFMQEVAKKSGPAVTKQDSVASIPQPSVARLQDDKKTASDYLNRAKVSYSKGDYVTALTEAIEAQQLDPANKEINRFIEQIQKQVLSK
jgi:Flp pilus assembly protein TadD